MRRSIITGTGSCLPARILTNEDLAKTVETSDDWITTRTGIKARHIAADDELTSDLATRAARKALEAAGCNAQNIDLIVLATSTPDNTFPATAAAVQANLGITNGSPAFDVQAVCSGFVYALTTADAFIRSGQASKALVIGAETFSRILDWEDRGTCVLFGDGAGAVVLEAGESEEGAGGRGVIVSRIHADGRQKDLLYVDGGPGSNGQVGKLRMKGREVFRHAVVRIAEVMEEVMEEAGVTPDDIDLFVPHQANIRILEGTAKKAGIPREKVFITLHKHGNTSAASIPLALDEAVRTGRAKRGDLLLLEAMGGGFTWGAALVRL